LASSSANSDRAGVIEVFADVCCPFTHVGLRRLVQRRDAIGSSTVLVVKAWPLELVNDAPISAELVAEEVEVLRASVAPELFDAFDPSRFPTTSIPAMAVAAAAYRLDAQVGEHVSLALRDALFERGLDISDPVVLGDIATANGVDVHPDDRATVLEQWREGRLAGVVGSPHFFADGEAVFCPSLQITRIDGRLLTESDPAALERFLAAALG
jgi:predicted DsbA family dithiol-disulfide isomerase